MPQNGFSCDTNFKLMEFQCGSGISGCAARIRLYLFPKFESSGAILRSFGQRAGDILLIAGA
ncbi:hypothetical protein CCUS01_01413 [Colletotrichum cuscutae]|uniref:Uncharacterized protein n=1 Tax=Colletotrichum cuscutae TaxID=1209917 RepID=A0AAI9UNL7_9PEZI|nr:hypothetical protein CCUS01_01413 [Colletotrichum cuscutae]